MLIRTRFLVFVLGCPGTKTDPFQVRKDLGENFGIKVNFSDNHTTSYSAYCYVTEEDNDALHSLSHPYLTGVPPQTKSGVATTRSALVDPKHSKC